MHAGKFLLFAALGLLLTGCTGVHTVPTPEARQSLAPSGSLRVGLYRGGPASVIPGSTADETKGVGYDLGRELARRLGVAFEPVIYPSPGALIDAGKSGQWDVSFVAVTSERENLFQFTAPFLFVEHGYLVPGGSPIVSMDEVDRPGMRIGAPEGGSVNLVLNRVLKNATVVKSPGLAGGLEMLKAGNLDAFAANKANLYEMSDKLPGSRVLAGRLDLDRIAIAIPKGRETGMAYLPKFIESAKSEGLITTAVKRAGLRGTVEE